jgi:hypothetical protein
MQLKSHDRRDVIEDLLDINIFSKMKVILRERNSKSRELGKSSKISVDAQKDKIEYQKKHIAQLESINVDAKQSFDDDIADTQSKLDILKDRLEKYPEGLKGNLNSLRKVREGLGEEKGRHTHAMNKLVDTAKFFELNEDCPTCTQPINPQLKTAMLIEVKQQAKITQDAIILNTTKYNTTIDTLDDVQNQLSDMTEISSEMNTHASTMSSLLSKQVKEVDIAGPTKDLLDMQNDIDDMRENLDKANDELLYNDIAGEMLKDTGIRTKIIKEYLPAMNTLINKYLQVLEFFVAFQLDENFQETIKSRHRDDFVYDNFSEGEKMRIDLSLLFAWRQIAKMKNSTNTNLLILDETFDSSLDEDGVDNLMKILLTLEKGTNTFIISHKPDMLESKLKEKIMFIKKNNFSQIG